MTDRTTLIQLYISRDKAEHEGIYSISSEKPCPEYGGDGWCGHNLILVTPQDMHRILPEDDRLKEGDYAVSAGLFIGTGTDLQRMMDKLQWAERAESFIRRCAENHPKPPIEHMVREEARELINQLEKKGE